MRKGHHKCAIKSCRYQQMRLKETDKLASAILGSCDDTPEVYEHLKPFMSDLEHRALGHMLELCPIHYCDEQICQDDKDRTCLDARNDYPDIDPDLPPSGSTSHP